MRRGARGLRRHLGPRKRKDLLYQLEGPTSTHVGVAREAANHLLDALALAPRSPPNASAPVSRAIRLTRSLRACTGLAARSSAEVPKPEPHRLQGRLVELVELLPRSSRTASSAPSSPSTTAAAAASAAAGCSPSARPTSPRSGGCAQPSSCWASPSDGCALPRRSCCTRRKPPAGCRGGALSSAMLFWISWRSVSESVCRRWRTSRLALNRRLIWLRLFSSSGSGSRPIRVNLAAAWSTTSSSGRPSSARK